MYNQNNKYTEIISKKLDELKSKSLEQYNERYKDNKDLTYKDLLEIKYKAYEKKHYIDQTREKDADFFVVTKTRLLNIYKSNVQSTFNSIHRSMRYIQFSNYRDPKLTPYKENFKKETKNYIEDLKELFMNVHHQTTSFYSQGLSKEGLKSLVDLLRKVNYEGNTTKVQLNEHVVARGSMPTKFDNIIAEWERKANLAPINLREKDEEYRKTELNKINNKKSILTTEMNKIRNELNQYKTQITEQSVVLKEIKMEFDGIVANKEKTYSAINDEFLSYKNNFENDKSLIQEDINKLNDEYNKLNIELNNTSILNVFKKNKIKNELIDIESKRSLLNSKIEAINHKISNKESDKNNRIKEFNDELKNKERNIFELKQKIHNLEELKTQKQKENNELVEEINNLSNKMQKFEEAYYKRKCEEYKLDKENANDVLIMKTEIVDMEEVDDFGTNYDFCNTLIRGTDNEIDDLRDFLVKHHVTVDVRDTDTPGIREMEFANIPYEMNYTKLILEKYPTLKIYAFEYNEEYDEAGVAYSESGYDFVTESECIGEYDPKSEILFFYDEIPTNSFSEDGYYVQTGEYYSQDYDASFNELWYGFNYAMEKDGKIEMVNEVILSNDITSLNETAYNNSKYLKKIFISKSVKFIHPNAFRGSNNLEEIVCSKDNEYYKVVDGKLIEIKTGTVIVSTN